MKKDTKRSVIVIATLLVAIFVCMIFANLIQTDFGDVEVTTSYFEYNGGKLYYKLYKPENVSADNPAPAVLLLHGYQNDKETNAAYAVELSRRGYVVLSLDEYGHGSTTLSMINRGYVNHKVTVIYGEDSEEAGTYVSIGGQTRYKVMMNFSNLSFFNEHYSTDSDGNKVSDSSMGGVAAYAYLAAMDFVDNTKMAITGHSMGTWATWSTAAAYSGATNDKGEDISPKAVVLQCGEIFRKSAYDSENITFNNVLLLTAKYDEFSYFRDYKNTVGEEQLNSDTRKEFLGITEKAEWNKTYGSFDDGSARRMELIITNHRLTTHNHHGMQASLDWFDTALSHTSAISSDSQIFMVKEWLVFIATLCSIFMMLPIMNLLLKIRFFADIKQPLPSDPTKVKKGGALWRGIIITMLIACFTYPFMTQLGHGLLPLPENIFRMTIGNGFVSWYLLLIIIMLVTTIVSVRSSKKKGNPLTYYDMALSRPEKANKLDFGMLGKSSLVVLGMVGSMYLLVAICQSLFQLDFRFIWPFFKTFSLERFGQFCVYFPIFAIFFILNNSKIFAMTRQEGAEDPSFKAGFKCWWKNALMMAGGILIMVLIEYIPFFANLGPGADLLFGSTFGGPFMSLMIVFVPQVLIFSILCTYIYRRTNNVYISALTVSALACWIVTGGSAML